MINQFRNSLLNARKPPTETDPPWNRYMPDGFVPAELSGQLETVRKALVGQGAWWDVTYRVEDLLSVLQSPRFDGYYAWADPRITQPAVQPFDYAFGNQVASLNAAAQPAQTGLVIMAETPASMPIARRWMVTIIPGPQAQVDYGNRSWTQDLTSPVVLDVDLQFAIDPTGLILGAQWMIVSNTRPKNVQTVIVNDLGRISTIDLESLFSKKLPEDEILDTYRQWWKTSEWSHDFIAGIAFGYLFKTRLNQI